MLSNSPARGDCFYRKGIDMACVMHLIDTGGRCMGVRVKPVLVDFGNIFRAALPHPNHLIVRANAPFAAHVVTSGHALSQNYPLARIPNLALFLRAASWLARPEFPSMRAARDQGRAPQRAPHPWPPVLPNIEL